MKKMKIILVLLAIATAVPFFNGCKKGENDPFLSLRSRKAKVAGEWTVSAYEFTSDYTNTYSDPNTNNTGDIVKSEGTTKETYDGSTATESTTSKNTQDDGKTSSNSTTTSGATITWSNTNSSGTTTSTSGTYAKTIDWTYTFEKDGTFKMSRKSNKKTEETDDSNSSYKRVETNTDDDTESVEGTWAFIGKDKTNDFKKKERIGLWYSSNNSTSTSENKTVYTSKPSGTTSNYSSKNTYDSKDTRKDAEPDEVWEIDQLKNKEMKVIGTGTSTSNGTNTNSSTNASGTTTSTTSTSTYTNNWAGSFTLKAK